MDDKKRKGIINLAVFYELKRRVDITRRARINASVRLNVLLHKMERLEGNPSSINEEKLKELHRDYEKLLLKSY